MNQSRSASVLLDIFLKSMKLNTIQLPSFELDCKVKVDIQLSYQTFGKPLHEAPIILVNHALTGNSQVIGENGWWNELFNENGGINLEEYTILCFNIPGNGFDGNIIENYKDWKCKDIAQLFLLGLKELKIKQLHSIIGSSLGGGIAWEMCAINPSICKFLIPIASHFESNDWIIANCLVQDKILNHSSNPIEDARAHGMLLYRTPNSLQERFGKSFNEEKSIFQIESWLNYHGEKLKGRFQLSAYKMMNQLLKTINADKNQLRKINATIHLIGIDTDLLFIDSDNQKTLQLTDSENIKYHQIKSTHGHDGFLIEYQQLNAILRTIL